MSETRTERELLALLAALREPNPTRERLVRALAAVVRERQEAAALKQRRRSLDR